MSINHDGPMSSAMTLEGLARVLKPDGSTPYDAWSLDPAPELAPSEIRLDVERLNLDATSFRDLWERHGGDQVEVEAEVLAIVAERGKMHNPRTGSGGVMMGRVAQVGRDRQGEIAVGEPVVTLVSNTLVPLSLRAIKGIDANTHQLTVEGGAILSPAARYARIPGDMPLPLALSVFDVCGVVPQTRRLATPGAKVLVIGAAGKAGLLATFAAAEAVGPEGQVIAVVPFRHELSRLKDMPAWVVPCLADATRAPELSGSVLAASGGALMDGVIDCASARGTEVGAVACCREGGEIYFFNMATSFQAAALGAEAVGRDVRMLVGFGLLPSAPDEALALVREQPVLRRRLEAMTGS